MRPASTTTYLLACVLLTACRNEPTPPPPAPTRPPAPMAKAPPTNDPAIRQDAYNYSKLSGFPPEVRAAFLRDFPNTGVANTEVLRNSSGPQVYKIVYIRDGEPHEVLYDVGGTIIRAPLQPSDVAPISPSAASTQ
jgi:hypothetical protein